MQCSVIVMTFMFKLLFSVSRSVMSETTVACHAAPDVIIVAEIG